MKIEIRPEIGMTMCNCAARKKMEAISYLVPELQSEMCSRCRMQLFQCFSVAMVNFNVNFNVSLFYYSVTIVLRKLTRALVKK